MKISSAFLCLLLSCTCLNSWADCRDLLDGGLDSKTYQIYLDQDLRDQSDQLENLITSIKVVMKKAGCEDSEINSIQIISKNCTYINPKANYSYSCFAEMHQGYFFVTQDSMTNINVTFNRWD